jgi:uncharacterized protein YdaU (DUF1376 family)
MNGRCSCNRSTCPKPGKHPRIKAWQVNANTDEVIIRQWWQKWPTANIALATGQGSGVFAVDIDGDKGSASLASLMQEHEWVPRTASVSTGHGWHLYFRSTAEPVKSRTAVMPGLDVRGEGGYVIAPPSLHVSGKTYVWHSADDPLEDAPEWLIDLINRDSKTGLHSVHCYSGDDAVIAVGARNETLFKRACSLRESGLEEDDIVKELLMVNEMECEQPLSEEEVEKIAASAAKYPKGPTSSRREKPESVLRYFKFNIAEWITDESIVVMTDAQRGRYISLLAACWPQGGTLSSDPTVLYKHSRATCTLKQFINELDKVMAPFDLAGDVYVHPRLAPAFEDANGKYTQRRAAGLKSAENKRLLANQNEPKDVRI